MLLTELQGAVKTLSRKEKLTLMHILVDELAADEQPGMVLEEGGEYPVWSPYGTEQAVKALHELLIEEKNNEL